MLLVAGAETPIVALNRDLKISSAANVYSLPQVISGGAGPADVLNYRYVDDSSVVQSFRPRAYSRPFRLTRSLNWGLESSVFLV